MTSASALTLVRRAPVEQCDKCGARAKVRAQFASGDLYFCLHHATQYKVLEIAITTDLLLEE